MIHHSPSIKWHSLRLPAFESGLKKLGFKVTTTTERKRINSDPAVLFGTSAFEQVERSEGDYLLVDRAFWGDPDNVRLGWNGRNAKADYKVPEDQTGRAIPKKKRKAKGNRVIVCGDYNQAPDFDDATHWKPHPAQPDWNPTGLPMATDFTDCKLAIVGASSVAIELRLAGIVVDVRDPDSMANLPLTYLAWCQWSWDEIEQGEPMEHLWQLKPKAGK
jgi:hypothetical protein